MPDFDVHREGLNLYRIVAREDVQALVQKYPVEALEDFLETYGYAGLQHEFNLVENIHVAHLVALNAMTGSTAENDPETKGALESWIRENWKPLFDQIHTVRESGVNWQEQIDRLDVFTVAGTEAALKFFDALAPDLTQ